MFVPYSHYTGSEFNSSREMNIRAARGLDHFKKTFYEKHNEVITLYLYNKGHLYVKYYNLNAITKIGQF